MLSYCLKCRKYIESKSPKVVETKSVRLMLLLKHAVCDSKKPKFIKEQEAIGFLSSLGIKKPTSKVKNLLLVALLLF